MLGLTLLMPKLRRVCLGKNCDLGAFAFEMRGLRILEGRFLYRFDLESKTENHFDENHQVIRRGASGFAARSASCFCSVDIKSLETPRRRKGSATQM